MLNEIKSKYILKKILEYISEGTNLNLFKYNKNLQNKLQLSIDNYKIYTQIEIEVITRKDLYQGYGEYQFINIIGDKSFYHIYFNELKEEIHRNYITKDDKISKIKIIIDAQITTLKNLFNDCKCAKEIKFIRFGRKNILDMSNIFNGCSNLIKLDISNFKTDKVTDMSGMFSGCYLLESLSDISKWNTNNVKNMSAMFFDCTSLLSLPDISKWSTNNVIDMSYMFFECELLKSLPDISNWNTNNVTDMSYMFYRCESLISLPNISKWNKNKVTNMSCMFDESDNLIEYGEYDLLV